MPTILVHFLVSCAVLLLAPTASGVDVKRSALVNEADKWFHWLIFFTILVAVGCAMEVGEAVVEWLQWCGHKRGRPIQEDGTRWTIPLSVVGVFFVIVGVAGEGIFEAMQASAETAVRNYDEQVLADTLNKAGSAADSASRAQESARQAHQELDAVKSDAQELERRLHALQPRDFLLEKGKKSAIATLKKYAGQPIVITVCGGSPTFEEQVTSFKLVDILNFRGAAWKLENSRPFPSCGQDQPIWVQGLRVQNSAGAPQSTRDAARALSNALNKIEVLTIHEEMKPNDVSSSVGFTGVDSPWGWINTNPSLIVLTIGENSGLTLKDLNHFEKLPPPPR